MLSAIVPLGDRLGVDNAVRVNAIDLASDRYSDWAIITLRI
ncbi:hypothetical protein V2H45_15405 [Tumidithrix elongata RA019]|uniref:Uncharacterized protein n=1 Tax=Tumidithrix elongata BACA0141 TaxID=2716417 RepID=A0AAW9Q597_9CYAN|nr:hypothetical protein [Tumidithrix elongata RA019]